MKHKYLSILGLILLAACSNDVPVNMSDESKMVQTYKSRLVTEWHKK